MESLPAPQPSVPAPNDADLLRQIRHGSEPAFEELVRRHSPYLYGVARSLAGNANDADDLVQDVFVAVLSSKFRGESSVRTWLVGILVKRCAMLRRSMKRMTFPLDADRQMTAKPVSPGTDAKMDLARMLETLSPEHREVIVLRELEQLSYEEMALVLSVPRGTVESRLHRAREQLKTTFKGYFDV